MLISSEQLTKTIREQIKNYENRLVTDEVGTVILVTGYSLGRAFVYATPEAALVKLPYEVLQGVVGAVGGMLLVWKGNLHTLYKKAQSRLDT